MRQIWGCDIAGAYTNECNNLGSGAVCAVASNKHPYAVLLSVGYMHHVSDDIA